MTPEQSVAPDQSHRPVKRRLRTKTTVTEPSRGRTNMPEIPRLLALRREPENIPVSEGSAASTVSPGSGSARVHPYYPVGEVIEGSSFEYVPSIASRAASATGLDESLDVTPISRFNSSPSILKNPPQVMSPNLFAGSASSASHPLKEPENLISTPPLPDLSYSSGKKSKPKMGLWKGPILSVRRLGL